MARRPRPNDDRPTFSPQHLVTLLRATIPPVHPAGLPFISAGLIAALGGAVAESLSGATAKRKYRWLRRGGLLAAGACALFFRHPPRVPPTRAGAIVAPADGVVCVVDSAAPPPELNMGDTPLPRVSIFLSVFDAHVQRAPVGGAVIDVQHRPGRFGSADLPSASTDNERTSLRIRTSDGSEVVAVQVAGLVARRIVCNARVGDTLSLGDTYGLIRFGSRLDTYLPPTAAPLVAVGQRTVAGETILALLS